MFILNILHLITCLRQLAEMKKFLLKGIFEYKNIFLTVLFTLFIFISFLIRNNNLLSIFEFTCFTITKKKKD